MKKEIQNALAKVKQMAQAYGRVVSNPQQAFTNAGASLQSRIQPTLLGKIAEPTANLMRNTYDFGTSIGTAARYRIFDKKRIEKDLETARMFQQMGNTKAASAIYNNVAKEQQNLASFTPARVGTGAASTLGLALSLSQPFQGATRAPNQFTGQLLKAPINVMPFARFAAGATGLGAGFGAVGQTVGAASQGRLPTVQELGTGVKEGAIAGAGRSPALFGGLQATSKIIGAQYGPRMLAIQKSISKVPGIGNYSQTAVRRVIPAILNAVEGLGLDPLIGNKTTKESVALDLLVGFVMGPNAITPTAVKDLAPYAPDSQVSRITQQLNDVKKTLQSEDGFVRIPGKGTVEQLTEQAEGFKPGMRKQFDEAMFNKDYATVNKLLPEIPEGYKSKFASEIQALQPTPKGIAIPDGEQRAITALQQGQNPQDLVRGGMTPADVEKGIMRLQGKGLIADFFNASKAKDYPTMRKIGEEIFVQPKDSPYEPFKQSIADRVAAIYPKARPGETGVPVGVTSRLSNLGKGLSETEESFGKAASEDQAGIYGYGGQAPRPFDALEEQTKLANMTPQDRGDYIAIRNIIDKKEGRGITDILFGRNPKVKTAINETVQNIKENPEGGFARIGSEPNVTKGSLKEKTFIQDFLKKNPTFDDFIKNQKQTTYKDSLGRETQFSGMEHEVRNSKYYYDAVLKKAKDYNVAQPPTPKGSLYDIEKVKTLPEYIKNEKLYENYPQLKNTKVVELSDDFIKNKTKGWGNAGMKADASTNTIYVKSSSWEKQSPLVKQASIAHETEHILQGTAISEKGAFERGIKYLADNGASDRELNQYVKYAYPNNPKLQDELFKLGKSRNVAQPPLGDLSKVRPGEAGGINFGAKIGEDEADAMFEKMRADATGGGEGVPPRQYTQAELEGEAGKSQYFSDEKKDVFKKLFARWIGERDVARTTATQIGENFAGINAQQAPRVISALENPELAKGLDTDTKSTMNAFQEATDKLYTDAENSGINIRGYVEDYVPHYWKQSQDQVAEMYQRLKLKEGFQNERIVPTYDEGLRMGLTPKYTNPAQIITEYASRVEQLRANLSFFESLKKQGFIVDTTVGSRQPGFSPIEARGFPVSKSIGPDGTTQYIGKYYAPTEIANQINRVFNPAGNGVIGTILDKTARVSANFQNLFLSGGIPTKPVNAFTIAQIQKELTSGNVGSPMETLWDSSNRQGAIEFFSDNSEQIKKMQMRNIPISTTYKIENLIDQSTVKKSLGEKLGTLWNETTNTPTFQRFMPMLQIKMFNDVETKLLESGKPPEEAADIAATAVKNFYGVIGSDVRAGRGKLVKDFATTFFFAPPYRESMINFWGNNAKAFLDPLAPANRQNLKFVGGALLTLGTMDYLNRKLNGHSMLDNPEGKKDKLLIPVSSITGNQNDKTVIGVPFLSSIATVPRAMFREGSMLVKGDVSGAWKDAQQTYVAAWLKPLADVSANEDYFGKKVYDEADTSIDKWKKIFTYLGTQYTGHPYIRELTRPENMQDPLYQRVSRGTELPFRFYDSDSIAKGTFYDEYYALKPIAEKFKTLNYDSPKEALEYYDKNKEKIDRYKQLQAQQNAYYGAPEGQRNVSFLSNQPTGTQQEGVIDPDYIKLQMRAGILPETSIQGNYFFYTEEGTPKYIDFSFLNETPKNAIDRSRQEDKAYQAAYDIYKSRMLSDSDKEMYYEKLGTTASDIAYYDVASADTDAKSEYVMDEIMTIANQSRDRGQMLQFLANGRKEVHDQMLVTDTVLSNLYKEGIISKAEQNALKNFKNGQAQVKMTGRGRTAKLKKINITSNASAKLKSQINSLSSSMSRNSRAKLQLTKPDKALAKIKAAKII